jgi:hypothetical protein
MTNCPQILEYTALDSCSHLQSCLRAWISGDSFPSSAEADKGMFRLFSACWGTPKNKMPQVGDGEVFVLTFSLRRRENLNLGQQRLLLKDVSRHTYSFK